MSCFRTPTPQERPQYRTKLPTMSHNYGTLAKFLVPDWGDKADSSVGLSYRPGSLCSMAGRYDNPMPGSAISPCQSRTKNMTSVCSALLLINTVVLWKIRSIEPGSGTASRSRSFLYVNVKKCTANVSIEKNFYDKNYSSYRYVFFINLKKQLPNP